MSLFSIALMLLKTGYGQLRLALLYLFFSIPNYPFAPKNAKVKLDIFPLPLLLKQGDKKLGFFFTQGHYCFMQESQDDGPKRWNPVDASILWKQHMHSFSWLCDIDCLENKNCFTTAHFLIVDWVRQNREWTLPAWRSDVIAERLYLWLYFYDDVIAPLSPDLRQIVDRSISVQLGHLQRSYAWETQHGAKLISQIRLACISLSLSRNSKKFEQILKSLNHSLELQIFTDGGHVERNPEKQLLILARLIELHSLCQKLDFTLPMPLLSVIDRMVLFMKMMSHGDGGLGVFNGGSEGGATLKEKIIRLAPIQAKTPQRAHLSGFARIQSGCGLVLIDTGKTPHHFDIHKNSHAGILAFEFSLENERLVVNCGVRRDHVDEAWHQAQRSSAAYSTVTIENKNSRDLSWRMKRLAGSHITFHPDRIGLHASHEGYRQNYDIGCIREWRLNRKGTILYGRDRLVGPEGCNFTIRFHLHPELKAEIAPDRQGIIITTAKGLMVYFKQIGAHLSLGDSIYCAGNALLARNKQIILQGKTVPAETVIDWQFGSDT